MFFWIWLNFEAVQIFLRKDIKEHGINSLYLYVFLDLYTNPGYANKKRLYYMMMVHEKKKILRLNEIFYSMKFHFMGLFYFIYL